MDLEKIPEVVDSVINNGEKASETFEKRPTGSLVYITLVLCICLCIYLGWQNNKLAEKNDEYGKKMMEQNFKIQNAQGTIAVQKNTIDVQGAAIDKAVQKLDSTAEVKKFKK